MKTDPLSDNIDYLTLRAILKWRNYPSIVIIATEDENMPKPSFNFVSKERAIQESDIPVS